MDSLLFTAIFSLKSLPILSYIYLSCHKKLIRYCKFVFCSLAMVHDSQATSSPYGFTHRCSCRFPYAPNIFWSLFILMRIYNKPWFSLSVHGSLRIPIAAAFRTEWYSQNRFYSSHACAYKYISLSSKSRRISLVPNSHSLLKLFWTDLIWSESLTLEKLSEKYRCSLASWILGVCYKKIIESYALMTCSSNAWNASMHFCLIYPHPISTLWPSCCLQLALLCFLIGANVPPYVWIQGKRIIIRYYCLS